MFNKTKQISLIMVLIILSAIPSYAGGPSKGGSPPPPSTYSFEDLEQFYYDAKGDYYFINSNKPTNAYASLPWSIPDSNLGAAGINSQAGYGEIEFPWYGGYGWKKGDFVFQKSKGLAGRVVRYISTFTHVSLIYDWTQKQVLESMKSEGVNKYNAQNSWDKVVTFCVKRLKNYNSSNIAQAVENALNKYKNIPYFPNMTTSYPQHEFMKKWADKFDKSSMYCSKLIWWVFKDAFNIDLDSNRTSCKNWWFYDYKQTDWGYGNNQAWIGISPDDIYYSKYMGNDFYNEGTWNLAVPLTQL